MGRMVQNLKMNILSQNEHSRKGTGNPRPRNNKVEMRFWKGTENPDLFAAFRMLPPARVKEDYAPFIPFAERATKDI